MEKNDLTIIHKDTLTRFSELFQATLLLYDFLIKLKEGNIFYVHPLYGQLRAILTDKSRGAPLLFDLAKKLNFELSVFVIPPSSDDDDGLVLSYSNLSLSITKDTLSHKRISLQEFIDKLTFLKIDKTKFTNEKFIEFIANNLGGAHYSPFMELYKYKLRNFTSMFNLYQHTRYFGKIIINRSISLLKKFTDLNLIFGFQIFEQQKNLTLFDFNLPNTPISIKLSISDDRIIILEVIDFFGRYLKLKSQKRLRFKVYYLLNMDFELRENIKYRIKVFINNKMYISYFDEPFLIINEFHNYTRKFLPNPNEENRKIGYNFFDVYDEIWNSKKRKQVHQDFIEKWEKEKSLLVFGIKDNMVAESGNRDLKIIGKPERILL